MQTSSITIVTRLIEDFKLKWQSEEDEGKKAELIAYTQVRAVNQSQTISSQNSIISTTPFTLRETCIALTEL
eukprot:331053-Rhodomonas_salina.5